MQKFLERSFKEFKDKALKTIKMEELDWKKEEVMFTLNNQEDLKKWIVGSDRDIGGYSQASLELTKENKARFYGIISTKLPDNKEIVTSGYAAIRSRTPSPTLFGTTFWDTSRFRYLSIRARGDSRSYFVNIQTDGPICTDLFRHRLFLVRAMEWQEVMIPFRDFVHTNNGILVSPPQAMMRERVKTIGFSITDGKEGEFCLEIDTIKAVNSPYTDGDMDLLVPRTSRPDSE